MSSSLGFYIKPKVLHSPTFEEDDLFDDDEDDQDFENGDFLQDVPYTSSSIDRSSIGSIPWADDSIKQNQIEWERVEKMLAGLESLPNEPELNKEILDWQKKFPKLMTNKATPRKIKTISSERLELDSLNLSSDEADLETEENLTLTRERTSKIVEDVLVTPTPPIRKSSEEDSNNLSNLLQNFTLTSVPLKLSERDKTQKNTNKRKSASSSSTYSLQSPPAPVNVPIVQPSTQQRLRMPPILNVIESTRKFRSFGRPSFVQLTQVQPQAKSAIVSHDQKSRSRFLNGHRSAWHVPLAANRFFNNRNSIILPAISPRQQVMHHYNLQPTSISSSSEATPLSSARQQFTRPNNNSFKSHQRMPVKRGDMHLHGLSTTSTQTNNTSNSSGRSISAAVQYHPRTTFNALYLPYSAFKFNAFK
ncbi:uncharacterized protein LOC106084393 [Stomoxys calcitrans]|uniref:uncharacterized protein LOC106084393 n=1 Tax=Stomoxys calcitrans TaxID=35570 RepID=UPI0027E37D2C|nr:uncharacterized protein LOC106084393 [Stomoxys calcitrans]